MRLYVQEISNVNVIQFEEHVSDDKYEQIEIQEKHMNRTWV